MKAKIKLSVAVLIGFAVALTILVGVVMAAATITVGVNPSPPQAIKIGTGTESYNWNVTFDSHPYYYVVHVVRYVNPTTDVLIKCHVYVDPDSFYYANIDTDVASNLPGCYSGNPNVEYARTDAPLTSPSSGSDTWSPPLGTTEGVYQVHVDYFSEETGPNNWESTAATTFWVANGIGTLQLQKFYDQNANGIWDNPPEPPLANWTLRYQVPAIFGGAVYSNLTDGTGTVTVNNVPAGTYNTNEVLQAGWSKTTPSVSILPVVVTDGGTATAVFGNVNSTIACSSLTHAALSGNYDTGSQVTFTVAWTKTGADDGAPVATLYFNPAILGWVSDTSGVGHTGSGTLADPYKWVLPTTSAPSGSFNVTMQFTSSPAGLTVGGTARVINGTTGTTNCTDSMTFGPLAVTLDSLSARPAQNGTALLILGATVALALGAVGLIISRRRK